MISNQVIQMIEEINLISAPIKKNTNLYTDLGIDSLSFINFLLKVEETFSVTFSIIEMEMCLQVDQLISLVNNKVKESEENDD